MSKIYPRVAVKPFLTKTAFGLTSRTALYFNTESPPCFPAVANAILPHFPPASIGLLLLQSGIDSGEV